jgi:hypothetical protein
MPRTAGAATASMNRKRLNIVLIDPSSGRNGSSQMHIAPIPGDGTWPEAPAESVKVVKAACAKQGVKLNYPDQMLIGLHDVQ